MRVKEKINLAIDGKPLKIVCVSDHFMIESFYTDCLKKFEGVELISIPYFGAHNRKEMR